MTSAEIITIGTEILLGEIVDTNTRFLARALRGEIPSVTTLEPLFRLLVRTLSEREPERVHQPMSINELRHFI